MRKKLLISLFLCFQFLFINAAYIVYNGCPDFMDITAGHVEAYTGDTQDPFQTLGVVNGRHTVITTQGRDPYTGNALSLLPAGESKVVRLGNSQVGAESEALTYHFKVDRNSSLLMVKFAVVLEDPDHPHVAQPRFVIRITDKDGNLVESCAEYDVSAAAGIPGFKDYAYEGSNIRWRDWTNVGLDLSEYVGKEIQLQFITYDCDYYGHFGYAYFAANCISNQISLDACSGNSFTASAPDNFASYLWDDGSTARTSTRTKSSEDMNLSCVVTSATGCQFTLSAFVSASIPVVSSNYTDVVCQGDSYSKHNFKLPAQQTPGIYTYYNTYLNTTACNDNITDMLQLTVVERYNTIKASICEGEDYVSNGFDIKEPPVGNLYDTIPIGTVQDCEAYYCLELVVSPNFSLASITGDSHPCEGEPTNYSIAGGSGLAKYEWTVPDNAVITTGKYASQATVYFKDGVAGEIILLGKNGCGSGTVTFQVQPGLSYHNFYTDTICEGVDYDKYGFRLGMQNDIGYFVHNKDGKTQNGCDSTNILALYVFPAPELRIKTDGDSVICNNTKIKLHAMGSGASFSVNCDTSSALPNVAIGDIYCTDGTIVKSGDYANSGKIAEGIVFYVDGTGKHGLVTALTEKSGIAWGGSGTDIPALTNYTTAREAIQDMDGYNNTKIIRAAGNASTYPAAWAVDFDNGWYLPAIGELNLFYSAIHQVNASIVLVGGVQIPTHKNGMTSDWYYRSSSEYSSSYSWSLRNVGYLYYDDYLATSSNQIKVRQVKSF